MRETLSLVRFEEIQTTAAVLPPRPSWMVEPGAKRRPNDFPEEPKGSSVRRRRS